MCFARCSAAVEFRTKRQDVSHAKNVESRHPIAEQPGRKKDQKAQKDGAIFPFQPSGFSPPGDAKDF
jgi:hypothetical protein